MPNGTLRLFRLFGIQVFVHWSWFLVAVVEIQTASRYSSVVWSVAEYVSLFGIVTMHEFGHALACRQVGGRALQIVLWPLGGVAYVDPPPRPGAELWSIAAGPLVNVVLMPVFTVAYIAGRVFAEHSDFATFLRELLIINTVLLIFNLLPIYPLDGGKILRALLWFVFGRASSLMVAATVGFVGVAGLGLLALYAHSLWIGVIAFFAGSQCVSGFKQAQALRRLEEMPRRSAFTCPSCKASPPQGRHWGCRPCGIAFDTFETQGSCPVCHRVFEATICLDCRAGNPYAAWIAAPPIVR